MLIIFTFTIIFVGLAITLSLYSLFLPFIQALGDIKAYNAAYYGALGGIERAQLVLKYHQPWFEGSWGRIDDQSIGWATDYKIPNLGRMSQPWNGLSWSIRSRTSQIPSSGQGNIDAVFTTWDTLNFNALTYNRWEQLILDIDNTSNPDDYYTSNNTVILPFAGNSIEGILRIPQKIASQFGDLQSAVDNDEDGVADDIVVNQSWKGNYNGESYSISPTVGVAYNITPPEVISNADNAIRESDINTTFFPTMQFGNSKSTLANRSFDTNLDHTLISPDEDSLKSLTFQQLLAMTTGVKINFSLVNLLESINGQIYPFLEYQFQFKNGSNPAQGADRFYSIYGTARVGDFEVKIIVSKPTSTTNALSDFTIIF